MTKKHIFIECTIAIEVLQEMEEIWAYLGSKEPYKL
jgi:hypothetical protein